jgi:signal transduction histidine kinase/CheY-like chemotaxis protein
MITQVKSVLCIPMKVGGAVTGVFMTASNKANAYTPEDIDLLSSLANIAAIAIQNAAYLEQARQQSEEIQEIINTVPEGVLLLDPACKVLLANPVAQAHLEVLCPDWSGGNVTQFGSFRLEDILKPPEVSGWHEVVSDRHIFQIVARPIESGPAHRGWVLVIREVTQEREVERRVQLQERMATVGQLAAGIAHDFNNIMSTIVLYAQMTARSPIIPNRERERINTIYQQAMQATDLIRQILDFSRRSILERQPLSLRPLIKEQARLFERTLGEDIHIDLTGMETHGLVYADPTRIQQVLLNLAINSRDAMPDGGILTIGLDEVEVRSSRNAPILEMTPGKWVRLTVSDTGTGIPPEDLPHIFEPFFTTKAPGEGTGLGLAQVYGIITQHEGYIDVSTQPGRGTTISLYLPALSEVYLQRLDSDTGEISVGNEQTILLVEDSEYTRQALVDSLELLHYRVISASNGQEALDVLDWRRAEIDLVISDVIMPEMSGLTLVREMAKRELRVPVLLLTGHSTGKDLEMMQTVGMVEVMPKPPSLEQLADVVRRLIDNGKYEA